MQTVKGSYHNLLALSEGGLESPHSPSKEKSQQIRQVDNFLDSGDFSRTRLLVVSNHLPLRVKQGVSGWEFEWDEDALVGQAKEGISEEYEVFYVGSLPVDVAPESQERIASELKFKYNCCPVFLDPELKNKYYKGFCKLQLWPLFHYVLPVSPHNSGRFDSELWQAYVKANKIFSDKVVEELATSTDFVWIHDYHLLVLPSLLRKRFNRIRCGVFLHSPFPSSEIFRTFPKREELLRSLLNADLIGFHTFDYARHFLSCCSRMLGLVHETSRGSITLEYYGRTVGLKIMPTGVNPSRYLSGFQWDEFKWRRGELTAQFQGMTMLVGVDDMDTFKGIELKLQAFERVLDFHPEWLGKLVLVQITNPPRSSGRDITELHKFITDLVESINRKYSSATYTPIHYLERHVPLHERMAFYAVADCAVVTATRDGMNLVPYEYIVCRQGPKEDEESKRASMLVVSEFVGCSPSLSGAIRVNPWSVESVADGIFSAITLPAAHQALRHEKHWHYISHHTVSYWAASYISDLQRVTSSHLSMKCYGLGLGLDTFRMVALDANFKKLEEVLVLKAYGQSERRVFLLDYDGTLMTPSSITLAPSPTVLAVLSKLTEDPRNTVCLFSGSRKQELENWFASVPCLGLVAENGFFYRPSTPGAEWCTLLPHADFSWKEIALPILVQYQESTDGSSIEERESALLWSYKEADPDFGSWQAKELVDHLEGVMSAEAVEVVVSNGCVEVKPQGVSKGRVVEAILGLGRAPASPTPAGIDAERTSPPGAPSVASPPDFILCIGDDRSDEDMFTCINACTAPPGKKCTVFACTVGQKPSHAPFYLNDPQDVLQLLSLMVKVTLPSDFDD